MLTVSVIDITVRSQVQICQYQIMCGANILYSFPAVKLSKTVLFFNEQFTHFNPLPVQCKTPVPVAVSPYFSGHINCKV